MKDRTDPRVREIEAQIGALFTELLALVEPTDDEVKQVYVQYFNNDHADNVELLADPKAPRQAARQAKKTVIDPVVPTAYTSYKVPQRRSTLVESIAWTGVLVVCLNVADVPGMVVDERRYLYVDVPKHVYDRFKMSKSKGKFFNRHVKGKYSMFPMVHAADTWFKT